MLSVVLIFVVIVCQTNAMDTLTSAIAKLREENGWNPLLFPDFDTFDAAEHGEMIKWDKKQFCGVTHIGHVMHWDGDSYECLGKIDSTTTQAFKDGIANEDFCCIKQRIKEKESSCCAYNDLSKEFVCAKGTKVFLSSLRRSIEFTECFTELAFNKEGTCLAGISIDGDKQAFYFFENKIFNEAFIIPVKKNVIANMCFLPTTSATIVECDVLMGNLTVGVCHFPIKSDHIFDFVLHNKQLLRIDDKTRIPFRFTYVYPDLYKRVSKIKSHYGTTNPTALSVLFAFNESPLLLCVPQDIQKHIFGIWHTLITYGTDKEQAQIYEVYGTDDKLFPRKEREMVKSLYTFTEDGTGLSNLSQNELISLACYASLRCENNGQKQFILNAIAKEIGNT